MPGHLPSDGRRRFLTAGAAGLAALWATETARSAALATDASVSLDQPAPAGRLTPPPRGPIPVAFVISNGATMIEYSILIGIITVLAITFIGTMGEYVVRQWSTLVAATS
jgi:Flp pilus assembly pilin Flp